MSAHTMIGSPPMDLSSVNEQLEMLAPARVHLGLINMSGLYGRVDGGVGIALDDPVWRFTVRRGFPMGVRGIDGELHEAAETALRLLCKEYECPDVEVAVTASVLTHIGLGSKTSLLMALGRAVCELTGHAFDGRNVASVVGRGGTSGAGVNIAATGGIVWDAGHRHGIDKTGYGPSSASLAPAPTAIMTLAAPELFVVHFRFDANGASGTAERAIFDEACPIPGHETRQLLALVAGAVMPCIADQDYGVDLQDALCGFQDLGLKRAEWAAQPSRTVAFRKYWEASGTPLALCLSSMGPTMFVLTTAPEDVCRLVHNFGPGPLHFNVAKVPTVGSRVVID